LLKLSFEDKESICEKMCCPTKLLLLFMLYMNLW
jgi:hypothetical protein